MLQVDISLPEGGRLMLDSEDVIRSFLPDWTRTNGNQVSLAFECESPAKVDELYERAVEALAIIEDAATRTLTELRAIVELCRRMRTVAEVSALLKMPLGVVRVLLSDLADQGKIRVYGTGHGTGQPDRALLERVLNGLRRL